MLRFLLISTMVLVQTISALPDSSSEEETYGGLSYSSGETEDGAFGGNHVVTKGCSTFDLEGVATKDYQLTYNSEAGCALLFSGSNKNDCNGAPDKTVKHGETIAMTSEDDYFGVKYAESC